MGGGGRRGLRRCSAALIASKAVGDRFSSTGARGAFWGVGRRLATSCSSSVRDIMSGSLSKTIVFVNDSTGSPVPGFKAAVAGRLFFLSGKRRLAERVWNRRQLQSADTNLPSCEGRRGRDKTDKPSVSKDTLARFHESLQALPGSPPRMETMRLPSLAIAAIIVQQNNYFSKIN